MAESREGLWMSVKERDRLKVLHEVKQRHITQKQDGWPTFAFFAKVGTYAVKPPS